MTICYKQHRYSHKFISLPDDQGGEGRHKCCGCAYEQGYNEGLTRSGQPWVDLSIAKREQFAIKALKQPLRKATAMVCKILTAVWCNCQ